MFQIDGPDDPLRERKEVFALALQKRRLREEAAYYQGSLIEFFKAAWPSVDADPLGLNWHHDAIAEHLEAVAYGHIKRLCINVPPRHTKTLLVSVIWPAWMWALEPDENFPLIGPGGKFLCLSYGDQLAMDSATFAKRLIKSQWYQERWGRRVRITADQDAKNRFDTTAGGTRISGSFDGTVTGRGGGIRIYDDPHKMGKDEVESEVNRKKVLQTYDTTLKSRITDPRHSAEVLTCQRGHMDDLSNKFLQLEGVVHLCLPAEYESTRHCVTTLGHDVDGNVVTWQDPRTEDGELLWGDRFTTKVLRDFKKDSYAWNSQWQQRPITRGGGIIKEEYWGIHEVQRRIDPISKQFIGWKFVPEFTDPLIVASLDTAFGEKEESSFNALTVWAVFKDKKTGNTRCLLVDGWQKHLDFHGDAPPRRDDETMAAYKRRTSDKWGLIEWVIYTCELRKAHRLLIEDKTRGPDVNKELRRVFGGRNFGIQLIRPVRDKWSRAHSVVDLFTDEMIYAPAIIDPDTMNVTFLDWADEIIKEVGTFPHGTHDDLLDTVTMALKHLRDNGLLVRRDEHDAIQKARLMYKPSKRESIYNV